MSRNLLVAALALGSAAASAQVVNTQVNGLTLTNGLGLVTNSSAIISYSNLPTGISYLTDNDTSTFAFNVGTLAPSASIEGNFNGPISSSATGIYIVCIAADFGSGLETPSGPSFNVQLVLLAGLSSAISYGSSDFTNTSQEINSISVYSVGDGSVTTNLNLAVTFARPHYYSYMPISFSDFSVSPDQVLGIRLRNFTAQYPDIGFIGAGYTTPIPEPSTYGLILGGLALAGAATRRRKSAK